MDITPYKLRMARAALNLSHVELSKLVNVTKNTIHRIEQGYSTPRASTLFILKIRLEELGIIFTERGVELSYSLSGQQEREWERRKAVHARTKSIDRQKES